ncbi:MAG TPA: CvpA family protein [Verrucomicrobiae bacterium]|nr:CvpA family protein [Verrucomicrobiae bacterium]
MMIWLLAVLLLASLAGLGYRQGAIRVGMSFFGILLGAVVAVTLGHRLGRVFGIFGVKDPLLQWALGPILAFIVVSILVKAGAAALHQKVDVYYKYHGGDLRLILWERLNHRVGLSLGLLNGAAYLVLIAFMLYAASYPLYQVATPDQDPFLMRYINRFGADLYSTGLVKVGRAVDRLPQVDFDMADFGGMLYRNPLAEARITSYPGFLALAATPEFQALGSDRDFADDWQKQAPLMTLLDVPSANAIRNNPDLLKRIWATVEPDLPDLKVYLTTGHSPKYDPIHILGRWKFDVNAAIRAVRRAKPNMTGSEMVKWRGFLQGAYGKTTLVARPDNVITIKDIPGLKLPTPAAISNPQTIDGQWKDQDGKYDLSLNGQDFPATVEGERLTIKGQGMDLVFVPME